VPLLYSAPVTVALDIAAWGVAHASTGYLVHRLPGRLFEDDGWVYRERGFERGGRFYVKVLLIKRWKGLLPEAGDLFSGGFNKRRLVSATDGYLATYLRETRRAELGHWLAAAFAPLFFVWNPAIAGAAMLAYAVVANGPCIAAQRYNRIRIVRILQRRSARPTPGASGFS
jgi:glycosyl-4,4'-diaponeurosporenoate acyltransferase